MKKAFLFFLVLILSTNVFVLTTEAAKKTKTPAPVKEMKAAFIYIGHISDAGWTYAHDEGRKALEK